MCISTLMFNQGTLSDGVATYTKDTVEIYRFTYEGGGDDDEHLIGTKEWYIQQNVNNVYGEIFYTVASESDMPPKSGWESNGSYVTHLLPKLSWKEYEKK